MIIGHQSTTVIRDILVSEHHLDPVCVFLGNDMTAELEGHGEPSASNERSVSTPIKTASQGHCEMRHMMRIIDS
jgi:hypothetical protein